MDYNELTQDQKDIVDNAMIEIGGYGHTLPSDADIRFDIKGFDQQYFLNKFEADYANGSLVIKASRNTKKIGVTLASNANHNYGYSAISIGDKKMAQRHQVIFFMKYGFTTREIHHADANKINNAIDNLSPSSRRHNLSFIIRPGNGIISITKRNRINSGPSWTFYHPGFISRTFDSLADALIHRDEIRSKYGFAPAADNPIDEYLSEYNHAQMAIAIASLPIDIEELIRRAA